MYQQQRSLRVFIRLFCLFFICLHLLFPGSSYAVTVNSLGDYDNIAVLEVAGDYAALDAAGELNVTARQDVSREFFQSHDDNYDFLVTFAGFDVQMPAKGVKAFLLPARNNVEGIGLELYDSTNLFSAGGAFLNRLEGLIEMGSLQNHVLEPSEPDFEKTLQTLTHEMAHRWAAYISYMEDGQLSDALLGYDNSHWSFLLDSGGSSLYGNHWRDNGDGTFTTVEPPEALEGSYLGRTLSPLELYLMGLKQSSEVPPLTLIESPGIDPRRPPEVGVTVPGVARSVTVDQIVAAMGERFPAAGEKKEFRMAFLLLVEPGWNPEDSQAKHQLYLLSNLQRAWEERFSALTDGAAVMQAGLEETTAAAENPGISQSTEPVHATPHVLSGVNWLVAQQNDDGSWQDQVSTAQRDTALALTALTPFTSTATNVSAALNWLSSVEVESTDALSRRILAGDLSRFDELPLLQNSAGGWGSSNAYPGNPLDSALALLALADSQSIPDDVIENAISYLFDMQQNDGGWSAGVGPSNVLPSAYALLALFSHQDSTNPLLSSVVNDVIACLLTMQNPDGGFGEIDSTVYETAVALQALKAVGADTDVTQRAVDYLLGRQGVSGSWHNSIFETSLVVDALYKGTVQADLSLMDTDIFIEPFPVVAIPTEATLSATVRNSGSDEVSSVKVALYEGMVSSDSLISEQFVAVPGASVVNVDFSLPIITSGEKTFHVVIDPDSQVAEVCETNNRAMQTFSLGQQPTVGFALDQASGFENDGVLNLEVSLSHAWDKEVTVDAVIGTESSAVAGSDYSVDLASLVFSPGDVTRTIEITVIDDVFPEADETLVIKLDNAVNASIEQGTLVYTILNDDSYPVISFSTAADSGDESATRIPVNVELSKPFELDITVNLAVDTFASTAAIDEDFQFAPASLMIPAGATSGSFSLQVIDDQAVEENETVVVKLVDPQYATLGMDTLTYTIIDNDTLPIVNLLSPADGADVSAGPVLLQYETNMPTSSVEVWLNDIPVATRNNQALDIVGDGAYQVRVRATNVNGVFAEEISNFTYDDSGVPPEMLWQRTGNFIRDSYHSGFDQIGYSERDYIFVHGQNIDYQFQDTVRSFYAKFSQNNQLLDTHLFPATWSMHTDLYDSETTLDTYAVLQWFDGTREHLIQTFDVITGQMLSSVSIPHQSGLYQWRQFATDADKNIYVVGLTTEGIPRKADTDESNLQLVKLDANGTQIWSRNYATDETDAINDLVVDSEGAIYLYGNSRGYFGEDGGSNAGMEDVFLIKLDADGERLWAKQWGSRLNEIARDVSLDSQGNLLLLAGVNDFVDGVPPVNPEQTRVIKVSPEGETLWQTNDLSVIFPRALAVAPKDEIVIAGGCAASSCALGWSAYEADGKSLWNHEIAAPTTQYGSQVSDLLIDTAGNIFLTINVSESNWSTSSTVLRKYSTSFDMPPPYLALDPYQFDPVSRTLHLSGQKSSGSIVDLYADRTVNIGEVVLSDPTHWSASIEGIEAGVTEFVVQAVGLDGGRTSEKIVLDVAPVSAYISGETSTYGAALNQQSHDLLLSGNGSLLLTGLESSTDGLSQDVAIWQADETLIFTERLKIDHSANETGKSMTEDGDGSLSLAWQSEGNVYLTKYHPDQSLAWAAEYSSRKGEQYVEDVAVDDAGNLYLAGYTTNSPDRTVEHGGGDDYFLAKFDSTGSYLWSRLSGAGHPGDERAYGLAVDAVGAVYLAGRTEGPLHGSDADNSPFLVKYSANGELQDCLTMNDFGSGVAKSVVVDEFGQLFVAGDLGSAEQDGSVFVTRLFADGSVDWSEKVYTLPGRNAALTGLSLGRNGSLLLAGYVDAQAGDEVVSGSRDAFWAKYDVAGKALWVESFGTSTADTPSGIVEDITGQVVIAGSSRDEQQDVTNLSAWTFLPQADVELSVDSPGLTSSSNYLLTGQVSMFATVQVYSEDPAVNVADVVYDRDSGRWSCLLSNLVENGANVVTVSATDGQETIVREFSVEVDTLAPVLEINPVVSPTEASSQTISGVTEPGALVTAEVMSSSEVVAISVAADGSWEYQATLSPGENLFHVTATDLAGNMSTIPVVIESTAAPTITAHLSTQTLASDQLEEILLEIVNLTPGTVVKVDEYYDVNDSGAVETGEPLLRSFTVEDEVFSNDLNVQGDEALVTSQAAEGVIATTLRYNYPHDVYHAVGRHLFRISSADETIFVSLNVVNGSCPQSISGFVLDELGSPVPGAIVESLDKWGRGHGFAVSGEDGYYSLGLEKSGEYLLVPSAVNKFFVKGAHPAVNVAAGEGVTANLVLKEDAIQKSGLVWDPAQAHPVAGVLVVAENDDNIAKAYTDTEGQYSLSLPAGNYQLELDMFDVYAGSAQGYFNSPATPTTLEFNELSSLEPIELSAYQTTCLWMVRDQFGTAVPGVPLVGAIEDGSGQEMYAISDERGWYSIGAGLYPNDWQGSVSVNDQAAQSIGYVGTSYSFVPWDCASRTLSVYPVNAWVSGTVTGSAGEPLGQVPVTLTNVSSGVTVRGATAADGFYLLGVHDGDWTVQADLEAIGQSPLAAVELHVAEGQTGSVDFAVEAPLSNTIVVEDALYTVRKATLTLTATSAYPEANLVVEFDGTVAPMTFKRLFKENYVWEYDGFEISPAPAQVTVSGPEGSVTVPVQIK